MFSFLSFGSNKISVPAINLTLTSLSKACDASLSNENPQTLHNLRKFLKPGITQDPMVQEIDSKLGTLLKTKSYDLEAPVKSSKCVIGEVLGLQSFKFQSAPPKLNGKPETTFSGFHLPITEVKKIIDAQGDKFTEILLFMVDNELLALMAKKCTNLEHLHIHDLPSDDNLLEFNDAGMDSILKMNKLKTLDLNCLPPYVTTQGIHALLSNPTFQQNLETLVLPQIETLPETKELIKMFQNLKKIEIDYDFTTADLESLLRSAKFKNSLEELIFKHAPNITDNMGTELSNYPNLKKVQLMADSWDIHSATMQKFLEKHPNLEELSVKGLLEIDADLAKTLASMKLKTLSLSDLRLMQKDTLTAFLQPNSTIETLRLGHLDYSFENSHMASLAKFTALKNLDLSFSFNKVTSKGFTEFCSSPTVQKNLQSLVLRGLTWDSMRSEDYRALGLLPLATLSIAKCKWFNDEALKSIVNTPLSKNLKQLYLNKLSLSDSSVDALSQFPNLKSLLISNCPAFTKKGREALVSSDLVRKNLDSLALNRFNLSFDIMKKVVQLPQLRVLFIFNNKACNDDETQNLLDAAPKTLSMSADDAGGASPIINKFAETLAIYEQSKSVVSVPKSSQQPGRLHHFFKKFVK